MGKNITMKQLTKLEHELHLNRLKKYSNFLEIYDDWYYQEYFVKKYINDIPKLAYEVFGTTFTYQQLDIWNEFIKSGGWKGGRLAVSSGHGCFGKGHKIRLFNGDVKNVEDIKVGDLLIGDDGKTPRMVLELKRGEEELYEFEFNSGDKHIYNKSHKLVLKHKDYDCDIEISVYDYLNLKSQDKENLLVKKFAGIDYISDEMSPFYKLIKIKKVTPLGKGNYYGFTIDDNHRFLSADNIVLRNTGKTRFIGNIVAGFFLLFRKSITRIQAPKQEQVTKFSWKEIINCFDNMTIKRKIGENTFIEPKWGFIRKHIQINKTLMYAKGFNEKWYIEPATAPKGNPGNLSGQHNPWYLLIFDEASGIEDTHIEHSLGGLSSKYNCCIMFSQHTRLQGKFHEFVTAKNVAKGGVWHTLRLSSRYSPMVSKKQLENWLSTYTEDEIRVRVDGLPPRHQDGTLISDIQAYSIYENNNKVFNDETIFKSLVFSYDLAYTGYRDSSIVSVYEVATIKNNITQKIKSYYKKVDIHLFQGFNGKLPMEFIEEVFKIILTTIDEYSNNGRFFNRIFVIGDATAGGHEPFKKLEEMFLELNRYNIEFKPLMWGSERLYFEDKKRFINARAKAYVNLKEALEEKRLKSITDKYKDRILNELKNIFYSFDSKFRYKILSKEEMKKKGVNSPDIADTMAQIMLLNFDEVDFTQNETQIIENLDEYSNDEINENDLIELENDFEESDNENELENQNNIDIITPKTLNNFNIDDEF